MCDNIGRRFSEKVRSFIQQYGCVTVLIVLTLACTISHLFAENHNQPGSGVAWTGFAWVQNDGHHFSGPMTITTSWHNWEVTNTHDTFSVRCDWEAHHKVTRQNDAQWVEDMTREGSKEVGPLSHESYTYSNLANTGDWFTTPGTYTFTAYTSIDVFILQPGKETADKGAETQHLKDVFTVD